VHFFSGDFKEDDLRKALVEKDGIGSFKSISGRYLGFCVVKRIFDEDGNKIIGRTLLVPYNEHDGKDERIFIKRDFEPNLYGMRLPLESFPFQAQDQGVSGCGTIAVWCALQALHSTYGTPRHSPAEITEIASTLPSKERDFPSDGLHMEQVSRYLKIVGLDIEPIRVSKDHDIVPVAVKAYINAKLPLLADLEIMKGGLSEDHLAVVSGYRRDKNHELQEIYVHDDQIGPFHKTLPKDRTGEKKDFTSWKNDWTDKNVYDKEVVRLNHFYIPVYPKIRLTFDKIYAEFQRKEKTIKSEGYSAELLLYTVNDYKQELIKSELNDKDGMMLKEQILTSSLPRFLWVIRTLVKGVPLNDQIFDGTAVNITEVELSE